jgi:hypothetical protein
MAVVMRLTVRIVSVITTKRKKYRYIISNIKVPKSILLYGKNKARHFGARLSLFLVVI